MRGGIDTNKVNSKTLISKKYRDGTLNYYKTDKGYFKILKTYTIKKIKYTEIYYSLGIWPLLVENKTNKNNSSDKIYYDKINAILWVDKNGKIISPENKTLYPKGQITLMNFEKLKKISEMAESIIEEDTIK